LDFYTVYKFRVGLFSALCSLFSRPRRNPEEGHDSM